jgi:2-succinyl-6-hydroxy-2,4-cyclohexadiene-1-carboxylate synthase
MNYLRTERSEVYYEDSADRHPEVKNRPVVVFLNGWALSGRYWKPVIDRLTPHYRCITIDQSGTGRTKLTTSRHVFNIPVFADEASSIIDDLGLAKDKQLHFVGHSMGSMVATELHHRYSKHSASVTIIACGIFDYSWVQMQLLGWFVETSMNFKWLFNFDYFKKMLVEKATSQPIAPEYETVIVEDFIGTDTEAATQVGTLSLDEHALNLYTKQSVSIQSPVLLCVGKADKTIPPEGMITLFEQRQENTKAPTKLVQFSDTGHLPMLEITDEFVKILKEHLDESMKIALAPEGTKAASK